jgi:hypothetical protein
MTPPLWTCFADGADDRLTEALRAFGSAHAGAGALALVAERSTAMVPALQASARAASVALVGGVFPRIIRGGAFHDTGALLLGLAEMPPAVLLPDLRDGERATAAITALVEEHAGAGGEDGLFFLFDAMVPTIASFLDGVYAEIGDQVGYVGANAGSETFQPLPCLFDAERVFGGGALVLVLRAPGPAVLDHGYRVGERSVTATSGVGNVITHIDHRPALQVYQELLREQYGVSVTRESFYEHAVHFPLGILRADGEPLVRIPVGLDAQGAIACVGELPANALLAVLQAVPRGSTGSVAAVAAGAGDAEALLLFYCAGRRMHLLDAADQELSSLAGRLAPRPVHGALSLGEIGCTAAGYPLFHNATLLGVPWRAA